MDPEDSFLHAPSPVDSGYDNTDEEKLKERASLITLVERPKKTERKQAIIESLIGSQRGRLRGKIWTQSENFAAKRAIPEKHFEYKK